MGSFYLSPVSALAFAVASLSWLVLVGVGGWYWIDSYVPWDWPGGVNRRRLLVGGLGQGFLAAQLAWFVVPAGWLNVFFLGGPPLPAPHPAVQTLSAIVTAPYWLSIGFFHDTALVLVGALCLYAAFYLAVDLVGQLVITHLAGRREGWSQS